MVVAFPLVNAEMGNRSVRLKVNLPAGLAETFLKVNVFTDTPAVFFDVALEKLDLRYRPSYASIAQLVHGVCLEIRLGAF